MPAERHTHTEKAGSARPSPGFHVVVQTDDLPFEVHLAPTQRKALAVGPPSCLREQNDRHTKIVRRRVQNASFFIECEHSLGRPLAKLVEVFEFCRKVFRDVLSFDREIQHAFQTFKLAIVLAHGLVASATAAKNNVNLLGFIPTPVANLRPAQQTCEQCHWPRKFYGAQLKVFYHFAEDEKNTPRQIRMLINTGGAQPNTGVPAGIHWHGNIENRIFYIATDAQRQVIPWVQATNQQGKTTVYVTKDSGLTSAQLQKSTKHLMDCIDCHTRPSHIFTPPDRSIDDSLLAGRIDRSLPSIKQQAVSTLSKDYGATDEAMRTIAADITHFYRTNYPDLYVARRPSIDAAIADLQNIYRSTIFPYMKVNWRTHPNNIGHFYSPGCFRCHDGRHASGDGKVIPKDCTVCHTVLAQLQSGELLLRHEEGIPFQHSVDIGDLTQVTCSDCDNGGASP